MLETIQTLQAVNASFKQTPEDSPLFEIFYHVNPSAIAGELTLTELLTWTGHELETTVEQLEFSDFITCFATNVSPASNSSYLSEQLNILQTVLVNKLTNLNIYRISTFDNNELYCIGQDAEGNFAGVKQTTSTSL